MRSVTTSCVNFTLARDSTRSSDSISRNTGTSASGAPPGSTCSPATSSALAPRGQTLRPVTGRSPSLPPASLYFWYSSRRRISSWRGSSSSSSSSAASRRVLGRIGRHQLARLDVRQRRRHQQVLAGDVEVERAHEVEHLQVLLGDERDRDVEDVELVLLDEVQQQIERPLELGQLDLVVELGASASARRSRTRPSDERARSRRSKMQVRRPHERRTEAGHEQREQDDEAVAVEPVEDVVVDGAARSARGWRRRRAAGSA